jgi:hypothetical protein
MAKLNSSGVNYYNNMKTKYLSDSALLNLKNY